MKVFFTQTELTFIQALLIQEHRKYKQMLVCVDSSNLAQSIKLGSKIELLSLIIHKITSMLKEYEYED